MFGNYNPYYNYMQSQIPRMDPQFSSQQSVQNNPSMYKQSLGLQGKSVDSLEVVKAMDIPLDGSISYFPLVDGTAIITKQLQQDGTSKTLIYKPIENEKTEPTPKYITVEEMNNAIKNANSQEIKDLKDEVKNLKRQIRDLSDDIKEKRGE